LALLPILGGRVRRPLTNAEREETRDASVPIDAVGRWAGPPGERCRRYRAPSQRRTSAASPALVALRRRKKNPSTISRSRSLASCAERRTVLGVRCNVSNAAWSRQGPGGAAPGFNRDARNLAPNRNPRAVNEPSAVQIPRGRSDGASTCRRGSRLFGPACRRAAGSAFATDISLTADCYDRARLALIGPDQAERERRRGDPPTRRCSFPKAHGISAIGIGRAPTDGTARHLSKPPPAPGRGSRPLRSSTVPRWSRSISITELGIPRPEASPRPIIIAVAGVAVSLPPR